MSGPKYKWVVVVFLLLGGGLKYGDAGAIASVFPLIRSEFNMSNLELAAIGSFFLWAYVPASPFAGMLADRVSRSRLVVWSLAAWSAVTLATGFVSNTPQLLFLRVLLGFSEAAFVPSAMALIADYHPARTRATAIGIFAAGSSFGLVIGGTGLGYMGEHFGWRFGFYALGAVGLLLAVTGHFLLRDPAAAGDTRGAPARRLPVLAGVTTLFRIPSYPIILLTMMAIAVGNWIFLNWLPLYFKETYQMSLTGAGFVGTFVFQGASVTAGITGGMFSDWIAAGNIRRRMLIQVIFTFIATPFLLVFFFPRPDLALLNTCIFLFSFLLGFGTSNANPLLCDLLPANLRSTAFGIMNAANCLAGGIGVMVAGMMKSGIGLSGAFMGISGMALISAGIALTGYVFFLKRDLARRADVDEAIAVAIAGAPVR